MYTFLTDTPLGQIRAAAEDELIQGLWFTGQKYFPLDIETWKEKPDYPAFRALKTWLKNYFKGQNPEKNFSYLCSGTDFQVEVWTQLSNIPYGKTTTYGAIAARLISEGKKASGQAVGGAVGHNPISILIPCHRVLGANGSLTGYAGGLDRKRALLELEGVRGF